MLKTCLPSAQEWNFFQGLSKASGLEELFLKCCGAHFFNSKALCLPLVEGPWKKKINKTCIRLKRITSGMAACKNIVKRKGKEQSERKLAD